MLEIYKNVEVLMIKVDDHWALGLTLKTGISSILAECLMTLTTNSRKMRAESMATPQK